MVVGGWLLYSSRDVVVAVSPRWEITPPSVLKWLRILGGPPVWHLRVLEIRTALILSLLDSKKIKKSPATHNFAIRRDPHAQSSL